MFLIWFVRYFLKRPKIYTSRNAKFRWGIEGSSDDPRDADLFSTNERRPYIRRDEENHRTERRESKSDSRN